MRFLILLVILSFTPQFVIDQSEAKILKKQSEILRKPYEMMMSIYRDAFLFLKKDENPPTKNQGQGNARSSSSTVNSFGRNKSEFNYLKKEENPSTNKTATPNSTTKSSSSKLLCHEHFWCDACFGTGTFQPKYSHPKITKVCPKCQGVDINVLYLKPCTKCNNTRKIQEYDPSYSKPSMETCRLCNGKKCSKGTQFEVAISDFARQITFYEAAEAYKFLGDGWRLPSDSEIRGMYFFLHKEGKGNFDGTYWGGEYYRTDATVYHFDQRNIGGSSNYFCSKNNVRMVRSLQ